MKLRSLLLLILLLTGPTGCSFFGYGIHNSVSAPFDAIQECLFRHRLRQLARDAWLTTPKDEACQFSLHYVQGFEDGFVDFLDADGTGEPPAMPPLHLRRGLAHSDHGQQDIDVWNAGFRHGARIARESGLRDKLVMPIALPARVPVEPIPAQVTIPIPLQEIPFPKAASTLPTQRPDIPSKMPTPAANPEPAPAVVPIELPNLPTKPSAQAPPAPVIMPTLPAQPQAQPVQAIPAPIVLPLLPNDTPTAPLKLSGLCDKVILPAAFAGPLPLPLPISSSAEPAPVAIPIPLHEIPFPKAKD